ncbi:MAG TPA: MFS transporter, partial [Deinococcales bacterium]|nr:MFS transporter [Deinococcales bacterium]
MLSEAALPQRVTAAGLIAFLLIGALQAVFGPAIPGLQERFGIAAGVAGLGLSAQFVGAAVGILGSGLLERLGLSTRARLNLSCVLLAVGCLGLVLAPAWWFALAAALLAGLGFGGLDINFNLLFATGFGPRGAAMLNLLNASFGVGAILGPLLVGFSPGSDYRWAFGFIGLVAALLLPLVHSAGVPRHIPVAEAPPGSRALLLAFIVMYFIYVGVEAGTGGWETKHLLSLGVAEATAKSLPALFWAAITAGRFLAVPLSTRVTPATMVVSCLTLGCACLGLAHVPALAPYAYTAAGLCLGPVFPTGLAWLGSLMPIT